LPTPSTSDPNCVSPQVLDYEAVVWGPGTADIRTLPPLAGDKVSLAFANNDRFIAGYSGPCVPPSLLIAGGRGVIWEQDHATLLATLGGTITQPGEFNSEGQLTGSSTLKGDAAIHAFLWQKGVMTDLGVLPPDTNSNGNGLNDRGQVVGGSFTQNATSGRPFLWENGVMTDLSTLIKPGSTSLTIFYANDINSRGEILATGFDSKTREVRGVMLIPCDAEQRTTKAARRGAEKQLSARPAPRAHPGPSCLSRSAVGVRCCLTRPRSFRNPSIAAAKWSENRAAGEPNQPNGCNAFYWRNGVVRLSHPFQLDDMVKPGQSCPRLRPRQFAYPLSFRGRVRGAQGLLARIADGYPSSEG
jgi:probable HAF family extracellular repeat protein